MENQKEEKTKIERYVRYDDRRKELTHITKETREAKMGEETIGEVTIESKGVYKEVGIRKIVNDLTQRKAQLEQTTNAMKKDMENIPEMTDDLKNLKEKLTDLQKIDKAEKQKEQLDTDNETLDQVKKDLRDIKETIGTRLKL
ncbi:MAG: hypothetical protein QQN41_00185 [Nitrosopumilus sp.]